ncbi:MAG: glycosyltransferase family 2 protein [Chitinophagaceae bacterium]|nr:glycosyltransferase family 2 protein [Chitinophagaceae bacterium]
MTRTDSYPLVSIILPTYNRSGLILETIESVIGQDHRNWELLVVDDRSTDDTEMRVRSFDDDRVRYHKTSSRLGVTGTRNEGLRLSKGELIAFIDSDDLWDPSKLEKQVAALQRYPGAGFSLTGGYNFRKAREPFEFFYKLKEGERYDKLLVPFFKSEVAATTPSLLFRRSCLPVTGMFDESKSFADVDFILRLARNFKGVILYEPLLFRRVHESNISNAHWEKGYDEGLTLIESHRHLLPGSIVSNALFKLHINRGEKYLRFGHRSKALHDFLKAWRRKPFSIVAVKKIVKCVLAK